MGFLRSSGTRKKKSYIHDDAEESARRRDMIKQKLYAEHMMDSDDETDDYLEQQLGPRSPVRRLSPHRSQSRRVMMVSSPNTNYIDPSGSLRNSPPSGSGHFSSRAPPRRAYSEQNGRKTVTANRTPPLPPRRTHSFANTNPHGGSDEFSQGSSPSPPATRGKNARFSMAPHPVPPSRSRDPRMASRLANANRNYHNNTQDSDDDDEEDGIGAQMMTPLAQRRPPPRRRRATVAEQSLQTNADAAMRFGPPRRVKSHYPGGRNPRGVGTLGMIDHSNGMDTSDHSKDSSDKGVFRGRGLFRNKSGQSDDTDQTVSSSERSSSFFRKVKRTNSSSLKRSPLDTSEHTTESQKSWFTNGSGGTRSKEDVYNSAVRRVQERQAIQNAQNYLRGHQPGRMGLSEQLAALPPANDPSDAEYDEVEDDDDAESKSIFSSIISKIEKVYDDCS